MDYDIYKIMKNIRKISIAIFGDLMLDKYYFGNVNRISPESPVPIVNVLNKKNVLGGAANVANNLSELGCKKVYISGVIGNDINGFNIKDLMIKKSIDCTGIFTDDIRPTTTKTRIISSHQQMLRLDFEDATKIKSETENDIKLWIDKIISKKIDAFIISDYNKGVCSENLCKYIIDKCNKKGVLIIVDPKGNVWKKYAGADFVTPNIRELEQVLNIKINNEDNEIIKNGKIILNRYKIKNVLVTRAQKGMSLICKNKSINVPTYGKEVFDVSGAGDTVVSVLSVLLALKLEVELAIKIANMAAGISIRKIGTYAVSCEELINEIIKFNIHDFSSKIMSVGMAEKVINLWKNENKKVVFTNGCFDILHIGHITYLNEASKLGDKFIIGLNSDSSVKKIKGNGRPIVGELERAMLLSALEFVDIVIMFNEDTPKNLIRIIKPDVLVKGGDYKAKEVVGREYSGETRILPFVKGYSTTNIINKIAATINKGDNDE